MSTQVCLNFILVFRDRSRSVVNLITQLAGVAITDTLCWRGLPPLEKADMDKTNTNNIDHSLPQMPESKGKDFGDVHWQQHDNKAFDTHM